MTLPYTFAGPYAGCYALPEVAMDPRHVFILHDVLHAGRFVSALELGSFNGASSTAFVEAVNANALLLATFCDVSITDSLADVVLSCKYPDRVRVTPQPSWAVLDSAEPFDFVLVDASHDIDTVSLELKRLLRRQPVCVMAHDTSATSAGYSRCEGAAMLRDTFLGLPDYQCIEDNGWRTGERTERGLFLATREPELFAAAQKVFEQWQN